MARRQELDHDFVCPHRHGCPHLEGLSTQWVWRVYQEAQGRESESARLHEAVCRRLDQAEDRVRELEKENARLKVQNQELHRKQFKTATPALPPADPETPPAAKKKRGAPAGHPGWQRLPPKRVDRTVVVAAPAACPHCQCGQLQPWDQKQAHVQEDIVLEPRTRVTRFEHHQAYCPQCDRPVWLAAPDELPGAYIGPVAKSTATYLRHTLGLSYRQVTRFFGEFFGLRFVPAAALGFDRQAARRGAPIYADVRDKVRASAVVHADETSWRHDGQNHWVWYAGHRDLACFQFVHRRNAEAAHSLLGEQFGGILIADAFASYNDLKPRDRQSCLAHLKRKAGDLDHTLALLPPPFQEPAARAFCQQVGDLIRRACHCGHRYQRGQLTDTQALAQEAAFRAELRELCHRPFGFPDVEAFRQRLLGKEQPLFFTFLRHPGVPPTNNQAEQSLRPIVIMRKILHGTRGACGLENHSVLHTLIQTARRQQRPVRQFLETLLTANTATAQAALYLNSA